MSSYLTNNEGTVKIMLPTKSQQKFAIGRTPQNTLQILNSTVSKNHAFIYYMTQEKKYVLEDLGSINGTYVNDKQIAGAKVYLKHNDEIVFGKCDEKYIIKSSQPEPEKKGKINFKDYHFELQESIDVKPVLLSKNPQKESVNIEAKTQAVWNKDMALGDNRQKSKQKFERAIKIPMFEQFLQLEGQELSDNPGQSIPVRSQQSNQQQPQQVKKWQKNPNLNMRKGAVKLPELNKVQLTEEDRLNKMIIERKKQLERAEKEAMLRKTQQQQRMIEQRLRLQIEKAQQEEEMLRQKYEIQKKVQQQQKNMIRQKMLLEQKVRLQQKQARQKEQLRQLQLQQKQQFLVREMMKNQQLQMLKLKEKQQEILKQVQEQKEREVAQIKQIQTKRRIEKQQQIKQIVEGKKRQLQLQAEALTRQYENIYKDTIKRLKLNIENEQEKVYSMQNEIEKISKENIELTKCISAEQEEFGHLKEDFDDIAGRNKAFLLYASHLQNKIDNIKIEIQKSSIKDPFKQSLEIKDSLIHSRKLLNMKLNQQNELQNQIKQSFMTLNMVSPQSEEYLTTILQNYQEIQHLKELYFQYLQEEKVIENKWDLQLQENNSMQEKLRNVKKQIEGNKKKLAENLNDNLKKLTEQRLHMLKMMYYLPEEKKTAAKYLIEQMVTIQQENKAIILDSEQTHTRINELIISIEDKKKENQQLSDILFGNNNLSHHFDNMKEQINRLIDCIERERDEFKAVNLIKMGQQLRDIQNKLYLQAKREKKLKEELKNTGYTVPPLNTEKNPLVFFGKVLVKKESQLNSSLQEERELEKKLSQTRAKVSALSDKKTKLTQLLEDYKQKQLRSVRDYLIK